MLRRRAFAEIHFRYALDLRRAAPVCKDRLLRAYRLPDAACDLGEARGKGGIMDGISFAELCYFVWGRMVLRAKRKIATVLP